MRAVAIVVAALGFVLAPSCAVVLGEDDGNRVRVVLAATLWPDVDDDGAPVTRAGTLRRADGSEVPIMLDGRFVLDLDVTVAQTVGER